MAVVRAGASRFMSDRGLSLSAGLAYYTVFSVAPLLVIALAVAGFVFGAEVSRGEVFSSVRSVIGDAGGKAVEAMVESAGKPDGGGGWATVLGIFTLIIGSTGAFAELQDSLNLIWRVRSKATSTIWVVLRQRLLSFGLVLVMAFILLVSLVVSTAISAAGALVAERLAGGEWLWLTIDVLVSFTVVTGLFASIFKILPDVKLRWADVWVAAAITAGLFTVGKWLIGLYLSQTSLQGAYGAAGSLAILLLWSYYSSVILFLGAQISLAIVRASGRAIVPKRGAEWLAVQPLGLGPVVDTAHPAVSR